MKERVYNILHIDTAKTWRGGQQQVLHLLNGLKTSGVNNFLVCPPDSILFGRAKEQSLNVLPVKMLGEWDLWAVKEIVKIIKKHSIKILHLHSAHAHTLGILAAKFNKNCKTTVSRRVDFHIRRNPLSKIKYRNVDKFVAISQAVKKVLVEDGISEKKIEVVYSGVDWKRFENVRGDYLYSELNLDKSKKIVGIIAAFAKHHKDHQTFLEAAKLIKNQFPMVQFLLVGTGEQRSQIETVVESLSLNENVKLTGFRNDIPQILSILDIFVLSSFFEGLGSSILEAMASSLPVVATNVGGIPEIVEDGINGILVPPKDHQSLSQAILNLLKNEEKAKKMGQYGYHLTREKFSIEKMVRETKRIYDSLVEE